MNYAYIRVSTTDQNVARQIEAIGNCPFPVEMQNFFIDQASGKDFDRPEYLRLKTILVANDQLIIKELDRLGRDKQKIKEELAYFKERGIIVRILNISSTLIDFPADQFWIQDMINNLIVEVLSAIAQEERQKIRARQKEGIALAKKRGAYRGRKPKEVTPEFKRVYKMWKEDKINMVQFTKLMGYKSRTTTYRLVSAFENELNVHNVDKDNYHKE